MDAVRALVARARLRMGQRMSGPKASLTDAQVSKIIKAMDAGVSFGRAVMMICKVSKATAYRWRQNGDRDLDADVDSVRGRLALASSFADARRIGLAEELVHGSVKAPVVCSKCAGDSALSEKDRLHNARWILSKLAREDYGDEISIRVQGAVEDLLEAVEPHVTRETYVSLLAAISTVSGLDTGPADEAGATEHTTH